MPFRLAAILFLALLATANAAEIAGTTSVIDGDTIEIHGERIRFHGSDRPEGRQPCFINGKPWRCGQAASLALSDFLGRAPVACTVVDVDRYGRKDAVCRAHGLDVNEWTVRNGWAVAQARIAGRLAMVMASPPIRHIPPITNQALAISNSMVR